ncbi:hypothetical protein K2783_RS23675, partial [Escherichia coli]
MASKADGTRPENSLAVPGVPTGFDPLCNSVSTRTRYCEKRARIEKIINQMKNKDLINYFC